MDEYDTDSNNQLKQHIQTTSLDDFLGDCYQARCKNLGFRHQYPVSNPESKPDIIFCCLYHAKDAGFCPGCGQFRRGIESFELSDNLCEDCE